MKFTEALREMKEGKKVKLPSWGGYWYWDKEKQTVMIQCRSQDSDQGELLDIRETQRVDYTLLNVASDEWIIADETSCPVLGGEVTFSFGDAIKYVKRGLKLKRKGWNGKKQYIQLATGISYAFEGKVINWNFRGSDGVACISGRYAGRRLGVCGLKMQRYKITKDADMLAPKWLIDRIDYKTVKFLRVIRDDAEVLKGVRIDDQTAKIGDTICFDGKRLSVERR